LFLEVAVLLIERIFVTVSTPTGQTDRQTDGHQTVTLRFPPWRRPALKSENGDAVG